MTRTPETQAIFDQYCDKYNIPEEHMEPGREEIEKTLSYQKFMFDHNLELFRIAMARHRDFHFSRLMKKLAPKEPKP